MGPSCGGGDGEVGTKRAKLSSDASAGAGSEDHLSALHDDLLLRILVLLDTTEAARTSVLACRWKRLWRNLPEVRFNLAPDGNRIRDVLTPLTTPRSSIASPSPPKTPPDSVAAWLPAAARRLVGDLFYRNVFPKSTAKEEEEEVVEEARERGLVELPCFEKATKIQLKLRYEGLAFPPQGVFDKLTNLSLSRVRFQSRMRK